MPYHQQSIINLKRYPRTQISYSQLLIHHVIQRILLRSPWEQRSPILMTSIKIYCSLWYSTRWLIVHYQSLVWCPELSNPSPAQFSLNSKGWSYRPSLLKYIITGYSGWSVTGAGWCCPPMTWWCAPCPTSTTWAASSASCAASRYRYLCQ